MGNKLLILPQLDKLEKHYRAEAKRLGVSDRYWADFVDGWLDAIERFRLILEGIDVTVNLEVDNE